MIRRDSIPPQITNATLPGAWLPMKLSGLEARDGREPRGRYSLNAPRSRSISSYWLFDN
jgi:hypothetical protein